MIDRAYASSKVAHDVMEAKKRGDHKLPKTAEEYIKVSLADCEVRSHRLFIQDRLFVPKHETLRTKVIDRCHSNAVSGHGGKHSTYALVRRHYY